MTNWSEMLVGIVLILIITLLFINNSEMLGGLVTISSTIIGLILLLDGLRRKK